MSTIRIEEDIVAGWRGYRLSAESTSVGIAPAIGGRIISLRYEGDELLFVQEERRGELVNLDDVADLRAEKRRRGFGLWGGDKTWIAPQSAWWEGIPPLDLDAAAYEARIENGRIVMESPPCRETGLRVVRSVELAANGDIVLQQEIHNVSDHDVTRGIWDVTQFLRPFEILIPAPRDHVRPYGDIGDSETLYGDIVRKNNGGSVIPCDKPIQFKFGALCETGEVVMRRFDNKGTLIHRRTFDLDTNAHYAHNSSVEIYNSSDYNYFEIEIHSPLMRLRPGDALRHSQVWQTFRECA